MAERIIPQDISPRRDTQPGRPEGGKGWLGWLLLVAVLLGTGVWLQRRTPEVPSEPVPEEAVIAQPAPSTKTPPPDEKPERVEAPAIVPGQQQLDRQRAEAALTDYLATKRALQDLAVSAWGGDEYARILAQIDAADNAFSADEFAVAADGYREAHRAGERLVLRADDAMVGLLSQGQAALAAANGTEARRVYAAALAIQTDHEEARIGVRRALTIERTAALIETGKGHEANRLYELALTDFEEAARLDPLHQEARAAAERVRELLQDLTFREAMTDSLAALTEDRLTDARARILQARAVRPDAPEVREALFQITEAERAARINALGDNGRAAEAAEDWEEAHRWYREVLAIDSHIQFAREGAERCAMCIRVQKQMEHFVNQPELLAAPDGRVSARLLITDTESLTVSAPTLTARAETLNQLLVAAETPVPVSLQSDGLTRVDVYQVGRFPPFRTQPLELLPGTYTIVGYRTGFQDMRMKLEVRAGDDNVQATVECRDRIEAHRGYGERTER